MVTSLLVFVLLLFSVCTIAGEDLSLFVRLQANGELQLIASPQILTGEGVVDLKQLYHPDVYQYYDIEFPSAASYQDLSHCVILLKQNNVVLVAVNITEDGVFLASLPPTASIVAAVPRIDPVSRPEPEVLRRLSSRPLEKDDRIQDLVDKVDAYNLRAFVEFLSGESSASPTILTRNSFSADARTASLILYETFTKFGFNATAHCYDTSYSCNVIGELTGAVNPDEVVVLGAHYDSRSTQVNSPTQRAPGANDDGSGTGTLLEIARILGTSQTRLVRTVRLALFSGEEQGLLGSAAYAALLASRDTNVVAMIQNDMIAYRAPGAGLLCGFPQRYTTPSLTAIAIEATNLYSPSISTGRNDRCCSDHRSFYEQGYPTTDFSDTHGPIVDPQYHQSGDLVNRPGFDFEQYAGNVKGLLATAVTVAELTPISAH